MLFHSWEFHKKYYSARYQEQLRCNWESNRKWEEKWGWKIGVANILRNQGMMSFAWCQPFACDVNCMLLDFKVDSPPFLDHHYAKHTFPTTHASKVGIWCTCCGNLYHSAALLWSFTFCPKLARWRIIWNHTKGYCKILTTPALRHSSV